MAAVAIGACGGSGSGSGSATASDSADTTSAATLLKQTFTGTHKSLNSGVVDFSLTVTPHGSSAISGPIVLSIDGPIQDEGADKLPDVDLTMSAQAEGLKGSMQLIATDGKAYIELAGSAYEIPSSAVKQFESGMTSASSTTTGTTTGSGTTTTPSSAQLAKLGLRPLNWISHNAKIVGQAQVGGVETTHVHTTVDTKAVLNAVDKLLGDSSVLGLSGAGAAGFPKRIPPALATKIEKEVGSPSFDVWTGTSDKTIRKFILSDTLPIKGAISTELQGMTSVDISLSFEISAFNQSQQITAPTNLKPFGELKSQLKSLLGSLTQTLAGSGLGGLGTSTTGGGSLSGADKKYSHCVTAAQGNVTKMQDCTKLLTSGG